MAAALLFTAESWAKLKFDNVNEAKKTSIAFFIKEDAATGAR